jgi:hypothetical protein
MLKCIFTSDYFSQTFGKVLVEIKRQVNTEYVKSVCIC